MATQEQWDQKADFENNQFENLGMITYEQLCKILKKEFVDQGRKLGGVVFKDRKTGFLYFGFDIGENYYPDEADQIVRNF